MLTTKLIRNQIDDAVTKLTQAESSRDPKAVQKAYEELFALCHENHLDLTAVLREAEARHHAKVA